MADRVRHKTVAVAVVHAPEQGFLLWNNQRWRGYAFPMRHLEPGDRGTDAALQAIADRDFPLDLPEATARPLDHTGAFGESAGAGQDTYYDFEVFEIAPGREIDPAALDPNLRFFRYEALQAAENVTWTTKAIARALVEFQEVVIAVVSRRTSRGPEFLLVYNPTYGYFFPAVRQKTQADPAALAEQALRVDTAYDGAVETQFLREVTGVHSSPRFGRRQRQYRYLVCTARLPGIDLSQPHNALEQTLERWQTAQRGAGRPCGERGFIGWFTADEMHAHPEISTSMAAVLPSALSGERE